MRGMQMVFFCGKGSADDVGRHSRAGASAAWISYVASGRILYHRSADTTLFRKTTNMGLSESCSLGSRP